MLPTSMRPQAEHFQLKEKVSQRCAVNRESIFLFGEQGLFLTELFRNFVSPGCRLIVSAPAAAEIALAADRAEIELVESVADQPLVGDIESIRKSINSNHDIIYLANPNRISGATFSKSELKKLAAVISEGLLIIDEYYHDFSRLSALPLIGSHQNVLILRPWEDWSATKQSGCGYALTSEQLSKKLEDAISEGAMSRATAAKCLDAFADEDVISAQIALIQKHSLSVAKELTSLGIKCQLSPTNFILLQVAHSEEVQEFLKQRGIKVDLLVHNGARQKYLRLQIAESDKGKQIIEAFSRAPASLLDSNPKLFRTRSAFARNNKEAAKSKLG